MTGRFNCLRQGFAAAVLLLLLSVSCALQADEFRPALLEINEREGGWVDVTWKVPMMGDQVLALTPVLPDYLASISIMP